MTQTFDIKGVPTILVVNKEGLLAWKGRNCAYDYLTFENFLNHILSESLSTKCPIFGCENCKEDISIENEMSGSII